MTEFNSENSIDNIQITENVLSKEEHSKLLDYVVTVDGWHKQPWGVEYFNTEKGMTSEVADLLDLSLIHI